MTRIEELNNEIKELQLMLEIEQLKSKIKQQKDIDEAREKLRATCNPSLFERYKEGYMLAEEMKAKLRGEAK